MSIVFLKKFTCFLSVELLYTPYYLNESYLNQWIVKSKVTLFIN